MAEVHLVRVQVESVKLIWFFFIVLVLSGIVVGNLFDFLLRIIISFYAKERRSKF